MVCVECNGKGYRIGKHGEEKCPECQGKGEFLPLRECGVDRAGKAECSLRWE